MSCEVVPEDRKALTFSLRAGCGGRIMAEAIQDYESRGYRVVNRDRQLDHVIVRMVRERRLRIVGTP